MTKACMKCGYERKSTDVAPEYECPNCGAIYAKVEEHLARKGRNQERYRPHRIEIPAGIKRAFSFLVIVVAWVIGVAGVINLLAGDFRLAALTLPALFVAVPKLRKLVPSKVHAPIIGILILGIAANTAFVNFQEKERLAKEALERKQKREQYAAQHARRLTEFKSQKSAILSQAKLNLADGNFGAVLSVVADWTDLKDNDLLELEQEALTRAKRSLADGNWKFLQGFSNSDFPQFADLNAEAQRVRSKAEEKEIEDACKKDLQCWGDKHTITAGILCDQYVEKLAKYSFEWTDGFLEPKFSHFRWQDKSKGIITFIGDKIRFQNGFGAWQNYIYECDLNDTAEVILDVRAKPGRL